MTLYEMTDEFVQLCELLQTAEDDAEAEGIMEAMDALTTDISGKAEAYARVKQNYEAEAKALKAEAQRLDKLAKAKDSAAQRVKAHLLDCMMRLGIKTLPTSIGKWSVQKNPASCKVLDEAAVPAQYHIPQPDFIDRMAILRHYKDTGELLPGVEITQSDGIRFK